MKGFSRNIKTVAKPFISRGLKLFFFELYLTGKIYVTWEDDSFCSVKNLKRRFHPRGEITTIIDALKSNFDTLRKSIFTVDDVTHSYF